jgi:two-component system, response regulator PdtaR
MAYLVKLVKQADLQPVMGMAMRRFEQFQALRQEATDLRQALEDRKVIERSGILMKKAILDEQGSLPPASENRQRHAQIARQITSRKT